MNYFEFIYVCIFMSGCNFLFFTIFNVFLDADRFLFFKSSSLITIWSEKYVVKWWSILQLLKNEIYLMTRFI